jgi:antitoxin (DNA-binding transcriptional repressor) of toxin-antitoxin stability system
MPTTTTAAAPAAAARGCSVRDANPLDRAVTGDTFGGVSTISLKQLHAETDRWVRAAKSGPVRATDRGEVAAVLVTESAANSACPIFPGRDLSKMPRVPVDSTTYISEERDGR